MNDDFNLEDILRKAIDQSAGTEENEEIEKDENPKTEFISNGMKTILGVLEKGSLIKLSKYAQDKMDEIIAQLVVDLSGDFNKNSVSYRSFANQKIIEAAKKIQVLHTIVVAAGTVGISKEPNQDTIELILKLLTTLD